MTEHHCLRCKTIVLSELPRVGPEISFYECPACRRQYALAPGKKLVFRWLHPISLALYGVIFDPNPVEHAETQAEKFVRQMPIEGLQAMIEEIRLELTDPTQQVRDMLDCRASEDQLREFLSLFTNHVEKLMAGRKS
jgi:hypothetical protein